MYLVVGSNPKLVKAAQKAIEDLTCGKCGFMWGGKESEKPESCPRCHPAPDES